MEENIDKWIQYLQGFFGNLVDENIVRSAIIHRYNEASITLPSEEQTDLLIADIMMAFYRSPKGFMRMVKSGDFQVVTDGKNTTLRDSRDAYLFAQSIYEKYDDPEKEQFILNAINI